MGLHHLLALTGDPARVGDQPGATSVYDLNSFGLVELIRKFNAGVNNTGQPLGRPTRFVVGVAFNPNTRNLAGQVARLRKKMLDESQRRRQEIRDQKSEIRGQKQFSGTSGF